MNKDRAYNIFQWSLLIFFVGAITLGITISINKNADLEGEQVSHTDCTVLDKYDKRASRGQAADHNYFVDSSCGTFRASSKDLSDTLEVGQVYDLSVTVGNWANKPTIITVEATVTSQ